MSSAPVFIPILFESWGFEVNVDGPVIVLAIVMAIDFFMGIGIAGKMKRIQSGRMYTGFLKKLGILAVILVVDIVADVFLSDGGTIRLAVILGFLMIELVSLFENLKLLGVPMPGAVEQFMDRLDVEKGEKKEDDK